MENISEQFNRQYTPLKALLIYRSQQEKQNSYDRDQHNRDNEVYVESYDIGKNGNPINAHPLSMQELIALSELFQSTQELKINYLKCRGIQPNKVLYVNPSVSGFAVWFTPQQEVDLYFVDGLNIGSGKAYIPAMVWKATKRGLSVYAVKDRSKPTENTVLYHAPYFNIYQNGNVCMGTVAVNTESAIGLEDFMHEWEKYFFNSYFSHTINGHSGCLTDLAELWKGQVGTGRAFPLKSLNKHPMTLTQLIR
jgi:PRTRC genetic system protein B